ncbi:TlpA family protein disulfide reductase [Winogradskyella immobilis]|uniref:TlpA family protein disulfide reductase n=1 Tax=Winogradskyella immobilis TaxID=2816852 RepID=A0ABS8EMC2_9FLAO|nr:TlpA disulfide reductase family protein [Winogradskyella immobilis]MCC1484076.1 TlpA family protein disulfide reductase [Winogradskyella immobilis]MCG0016168.1 TlpA family protein disulfide reductase [Winogradskyella immobilis]
MKQFLVIIILVVFGCKNSNEVQPVEEIEPIESIETDLEIYDFEGLKPFLNQEDDKIHVVNFWATWCAPCVKELPYFETVNRNYADKNVEVLLVSLDFPRQYDTKLKPFLKKEQLNSKVICFDDIDQNTWIPAIDKDWSGAIPATLIYKNGKRKFYEGSFTMENLEAELKNFLN